MHKITANEYRLKFKVESLVSEGVRNNLQISHLGNTSRLGTETSLQARKNLSKCLLGSKRRKGTKTSVQGLENMSKANKKRTSGKSYEEIYGVEIAKKLKFEIGKRLRGKKRLPYSEEWRGKLSKSVRLTRLKRIENNYGILSPFYNPKACEYFKKFDEENKTQGHYAVYGGGEFQIKELGYFPDYINFEKKLIMEWDENTSKHFDKNGNLREKDVIRQKQIQAFYPDFQFKRIKESINVMVTK